jgi:hypothetical protein
MHINGAILTHPPVPVSVASIPSPMHIRQNLIEHNWIKSAAKQKIQEQPMTSIGHRSSMESESQQSSHTIGKNMKGT